MLRNTGAERVSYISLVPSPSFLQLSVQLSSATCTTTKLVYSKFAEN